MKRACALLLAASWPGIALAQDPGAPGAPAAASAGVPKNLPVEVTSINGMEWRQDEQVIIASGDARAVRGDVTVTADRLLAHYRKKTPPAGAPAPPPKPAAPADPSATGDTGDNEIYRLEAEGHVHIFNATDQAFGDRAVYDVDQAVLVMTGHDLHIITPQDTMTARDTMEYWSQKHMAIGRGDAVVNTSDGRRMSGDTLVGYTTDPNAPPPAGAPAKPVAAKPSGDSIEDAGKLQRVDAFGHVEVRTATEIIHADKAVYIPDTGIARMAGNVHITRGQNELNGDTGVVNLRTGVSTLTRNPGSRVEGLVVPTEANGGAKPAPAAPAPASKEPPK